MSVTTTPTTPAESPNKMTTRSQVRSSNTSLNCSMDTESINKRDRQKKSQSNHPRTPGLLFDSLSHHHHHSRDRNH